MVRGRLRRGSCRGRGKVPAGMASGSSRTPGGGSNQSGKIGKNGIFPAQPIPEVVAGQRHRRGPGPRPAPPGSPPAVRGSPPGMWLRKVRGGCCSGLTWARGMPPRCTGGASCTAALLVDEARSGSFQTGSGWERRHRPAAPWARAGNPGPPATPAYPGPVTRRSRSG